MKLSLLNPALAITCLLTFLYPVSTGAAESLEWPEEWTVFAPLDRKDPALDAATLASMPEFLTLPAAGQRPERQVQGQKLEVEPGQAVDLSDFFEIQKAGNTAYVFVELNSPVEQTVTLGMGGDWWLETWINGQPLYDTLEKGNQSGSPGILDHQVEAKLKKGSNILAVRFITGKASSLLALGGPDEIARAQTKAAQAQAGVDLNTLPERFEDRLRFPVEEQALVMARRGFHFPETEADFKKGGLAGVQPMPERQLVFQPVSKKSGEVVDTVDRRFDEPVTILLSRERYPSEDGHLDAIVWTTPDTEDTKPAGLLEILLKDNNGKILSKHVITPVFPHGVFFSVGLPDSLTGEEGALEVIWKDGENELGRSTANFSVDAPTDVATSGRIPLRILNGAGATLSAAPMTVGVPFPRGALFDESKVRLVDEAGIEIPLQTLTTAKWSRFGPVKWLLCDFNVDLQGKPREVFLEFGPGIKRTVHPEIATGKLEGGFPALDTGRIRIDGKGLAFDASGKGNFQSVLAPEALRGAFVTRENGKTYVMPAEAEYAWEELGSEKAVVLRTGWYREEATGDPFCQFVTRFVFHRQSPVVRIFHTWIFTGDGNRERIADMGWRFDAAQIFENGEILTSFEDGTWLTESSLVQFDYQNFLLAGSGKELPGRTPGVLTGTTGNSRVTLGVKDFWQNFPSELEHDAKGFTFFNWPKRNPPERLTRPVRREDAFRHRFVHEGELLDFKIPEEYSKGEIRQEAFRTQNEQHIDKDRPESVNAQGIARTEELFLFFADESTTPDDAARVMQGLNDESLRAVADPKWVAASGVFGVIHHRDPENFPEDERIYEEVALAPTRWVEKLGFYGMWLHGDYPTWNMNLENETVSTYRTLRKNHHTFPYRWVPFARSGDPRLLKPAQSAVRQMTDANFCHFATAEVDETVAPTHFRRQGWWDRCLLPWAGRNGPHLRSYTIDSDYLWDAYYVTGYTRARDVALLFGDLTQHDYVAPSLRNQNPGGIRARPTESILFSYVHMYEATFDPWFLNAATEVARLHAYLYADAEIDALYSRPDEAGSFWRGADQAYYRLRRSEQGRRTALNNAKAWASPRASHARSGDQSNWGTIRTGVAPFAWLETGDDLYLRRAAATLDSGRFLFYEGEREHLRGSTNHSMNHGVFAMAWMAGMPRAQAVLAKANHFPSPVPDSFQISPEWLNREDKEVFHWRSPRTFVHKDGKKEVTLLLDQHGMTLKADCEIIGPDGKIYRQEPWVAPAEIKISPDAPEGTYQVQIEGAFPYPSGADSSRFGRGYGDPSGFRRVQGQLFFPLSDPDTPEVIAFPRSKGGIGVPAAEPSGWWFQIPENTEAFWVSFPSFQRPRQVTVWNPEGERAWTGHLSNEPQKIEIPVLPGQAGQLWRVTGSSFELDPAIPPYFSVSSSKWFLPVAEQKGGANKEGR
jgi:hypothetical protein